MNYLQSYADPLRIILSVVLAIMLVGASVPTLTIAETSANNTSVPTLPTVPDLSVPPLPTVPDLTVPPLPTVPDLSSSSTSQVSTFCRITASAETVTQGGSVTLTWNTQGFSSITINGQAVSQLSGNRTYTNIQENTTYTLIAKTADGKSSCTATVTITCLPPVVDKKCELDVKKTVNKSTAQPLDSLIYTITVKNSGTGDCSGTGVKIEDVLDPRIVYQSYSLSNNVLPGYGTDPVYRESDRTLRFNAQTLRPGEQATITWTGQVSKPAQCGNFVVSNQAKAAAKELQNFQTWVSSNTVKTDISYICPPTPPTPPVPPSCPLEAKAGRTIINFGGSNLRTDLAANRSVTTSVSTAVAAGDYAVTLVAWDGYIGRENMTQPREQWQLRFMTGGSAVVATKSTTDLADRLRTVTQIEQVETNFTVPAGVTAVQGVHPFYPDTSSPNSLYPLCAALDKILPPPPPVVPPVCVDFTATPTAITRGQSATLTWNTTGSERVVISGAVGEVAATGTITVSPLVTSTYTLTVFGANQQTDDCTATVTVTVPPTPTNPVCEAFTATPAQVPFGGGTTTLAWTVRNASTTSINQTVGAVTGLTSKDVFVNQNTTFVLTAADGDKTTTCSTTVTVAPPPPANPLTCAGNVQFSASPTSIVRGQSSTLTWSTTNVDSLSISGGVSATSLTGSAAVNPSDTTTYILTANRGSESVQCPTTVSVSTGGGGGGGGGSGATPRCELIISKKVISPGDSVTLRWNSSFSNDVVITDNFGATISDSKKYLSRDKDAYLSGSVTLRPNRTTTYTMVAERGTRDVSCTAKVELNNPLVVLETRDQQPLLAGIALTDIPHTGFAAGPFVTVMFYLLLGAWAVLIAYLLVVRRDRIAGYEMATAQVGSDLSREHLSVTEATPIIPPGLFVERVQPPVIPPLSHLKDTPDNLPTGTPVVGYAAAVASAVTSAPTMVTESRQVSDATVTALEDHAHNQKTLLSSDAIRFFVATVPDAARRLTTLDQMIADAKTQYPLEDGWMVINEARMRNLCEACKTQPITSDVAPHIPTTIPAGSGSLAEAIVTGNVVAAYQMIGHRPMFALADAAADLDSIVRQRAGETVIVSGLLQVETTRLSDEQLRKMITALTSAIDGTYTDEASAVKMAIMKAVKEVA